MVRHFARSLPFLCLLVAAALPSPGTAQDSPDLVTDRPDQTESAVVLPGGAFQAEFGTAFGHDTSDGVTTEVLEIPGTLLRYGLSPRFELRLAWPGEIDLEARSAR